MKNKIIKTAKSMFLKEGYEKVSVQKIIDHVKIAKGTFYHYFKSKEELLDEVANLINNDINSVVKLELEKLTGNAIDKINSINKVSQIVEMKYFDYVISLKKRENIVLKEKVLNLQKEFLIEIFTKIINQGISEKIINVKFEEYIPVLLVNNIYGITSDFDKLVEDKNFEEIVKRLKFVDYIVAKLLGLKDGEIKTFNEKDFEKILGGIVCGRE